MFFKNHSDNCSAVGFGKENSCLGRFPFVLNIHDSENILKINLSGCVDGEKGTDIGECPNAKLAEALKDSTPVYPDKDNVYEITFSEYVIYQVRNELYCTLDDYCIGKGNKLVIYERSRLLDYYNSVTPCAGLFAGKRKHYAIESEFHIIDVISLAEPTIKKI